MSGVEWEKALWKPLPFPDNYIPREAFLSSLRTNPNFQPYTYWTLVRLSGAITQHLATLFTFLAVYVLLKEGLLDSRLLIWVSIACFILGFAVWTALDCTIRAQVDHRARLVKATKSSILLFLALMSLSPVLGTLTAATSSDSIWALSAFLFFLNVILADYSARQPGLHVQERLTSVLSMNAAISSSVVLASRLSDDLSVFALILFAVQLFALFPLLRHRLQASQAAVQYLLTVSISILSLLLTISISHTVTTIFAAALLSVSFVAPGVLIWAQRFKNEIRGPWDVAVPKIN
ncbi:hypothetical protein HGRIS_007897 [Hohenbuehelia grisea]|uniref:Phosphatidylinositol N-acetylglucosaminyltransferase n=1 Tax=Hohenbuehelia grisea TaxID=104357 RepID=A0ABR3J689_9AGAR